MFLAWKEFKHSKGKYSLIGLIMIAILFLVFFITGLANGLSFADSSAIRNLKADYILIDEEANDTLIRSALTQKQVDAIREQLDGDSTPLAITMSAVTTSEEKNVDIAYFSVDMENYAKLEISEGKNIDELTGNEVIVDEFINIHGDFQLGDKLIDRTSGKEMIIAGFTRDHTYSHVPVIYADTSLALNAIYGTEPSYNAVLFTGSKVTVDGFDTLTIDEAVQSIPGYSQTQGSLMMMVVFLFFIAGFVSTIFFYIITIQKINQFGILKAVGANTPYIAKSIVIQVFTLTTIGLLVSVALIYGMSQVMPTEMPFRFSTTLVLNTAALFLVVNSFGSLLSVYKAAKADAIEAIGRGE